MPRQTAFCRVSNTIRKSNPAYQNLTHRSAHQANQWPRPAPSKARRRALRETDDQFLLTLFSLLSLLSRAGASRIKVFPSQAVRILAHHRTSNISSYDITKHEWVWHSVGLFSSPVQKLSNKATGNSDVTVHFQTRTAQGLHNAPERGYGACPAWNIKRLYPTNYFKHLTAKVKVKVTHCLRVTGNNTIQQSLRKA